MVGVRQRPAVDERGDDHRQAHPRRRQPVELIEQPLGVAQRQVRHRVQAAPPSATTVAAQRFHAPMFAVSVGSDSDRRRSHNTRRLLTRGS